MVKQGAQATRPGETEQAGNLKPNERDELNRWQREEARTAEEKEGTLERRDRDERAWRHHLERQRKEQEDKERLERERQEREQQERQRRERDRQALESIERSRAERERQQKYDREREEREERERAEEERIMNQMQREELNEQRERENHLKQLEEEQKQLREMEQSRLSKLSRDKGSKEFLDTIEALSADEVEREFQKRLEAMRNRRESAEDEEVNASLFVILTFEKFFCVHGNNTQIAGMIFSGVRSWELKDPRKLYFHMIIA